VKIHPLLRGFLIALIAIAVVERVPALSKIVKGA
jgi:hypothetical protein